MTLSRRLVPAVLAGALTAAAVALTPPAAVAQPRPAGHPAVERHDAGRWLVVADATAHAVHVVDVRTGRVTGSLKGVTFGTHAGALQLGSGRIGFMDEAGPRLDIVRIDPSGRPVVEAHYAIPDPSGDWERAGWLATDHSRRYIAVGSDFDGSTTQRVTVIDRVSATARTVSVPVSSVTTSGEPGTEEMEVFLVGSPLRLVVTAGGHLDAYRLSDILAGDRRPTAFARAPLAAYPHGPIANDAGTVIGSDLAVGVQTVRVTASGFGAARFALYPVAALQSYRPLMAPDGVTSVGTQAGRTPDGTTWDRVPAYLTTASTTTGAIASVRVGTGSFTRAVATRSYAAAALTTTGGDRLVLVERDPRTGAYSGEIHGVSLARLAADPTPGQGTTAATNRFVAASPDGHDLFVSRGGEGLVTQLAVVGDTTTRRRDIPVPTALADGGYLTVVDPGVRPYDLAGR